MEQNINGDLIKEYRHNNNEVNNVDIWISYKCKLDLFQFFSSAICVPVSEATSNSASQNFSHQELENQHL